MNDREACMRRHPSARRRIDRDTAYLIFTVGMVAGLGCANHQTVTTLDTLTPGGRADLAAAIVDALLDNPMLRGEFENGLAAHGITLTGGGAA